MLTKSVSTSLAERRSPVVALIALLAMTGVIGAAEGSVTSTSNSSAVASSFTAATDDPTGVDLRVNVLGPTTTPSPTSTPTSPAPPSRSSDTTPAATRPSVFPAKAAVVPGVTQATVEGPAEGIDALGADPIAVSGVFSVGGVTVTPVTDFGPGGGDIQLAFTLTNVTAAPLTSHLKFWITNIFGMQLVAIDDVEVADLAPEETRTVTATLQNVGQWTVFTGHVTLTPPPEFAATDTATALDAAAGVDTATATEAPTAMAPVSRESLIVIPPYFLLSVLAGAGALILLLRSVRRLRTARPATVTAGEAS